MNPLDTANRHLAGATDDGMVTLQNGAPKAMTVQQAANLAAWLLTMCDDAEPGIGPTFRALLCNIRGGKDMFGPRTITEIEPPPQHYDGFPESVQRVVDDLIPALADTQDLVNSMLRDIANQPRNGVGIEVNFTTLCNLLEDQFRKLADVFAKHARRPAIGIVPRS